ncbi:MAG: hydrolase [Desulfomonile tiedjei]|nr:hydrolase [Desulfomonile tiedjei]
MLAIENTILVLVDVQEKLARAMHEKDALLESTVKLIQGAKVLGLPIMMTEQNPKGLGNTVPEVAELLSDLRPVTKLSFSCCGEIRFMEQLEELNRKQALVAGIESHVCVYQTVMDLVNLGYDVQVVADAVASRTAENKAIGLERCKELGASITSTETALFELLRVAEGEKFKQMLKVVK